MRGPGCKKRREIHESLSHELKRVVVAAAETKEEYVKIFYSPVRRVDEEEEVAVDIYWMHRPQKLCDRVAKAVTDFLKARGKGFTARASPAWALPPS